MKHPIRNALLALALLAGLSLSALGAAGIYERAVPAASVLNNGEGLYCGLIARGLPSGAVLTVVDQTGTAVCTVTLPENGQTIAAGAPDEASHLPLGDQESDFTLPG